MICLVAMNGGDGTVQTVLQAIVHETPVVIVNNSGRAADIMAFAYNNREYDLNLTLIMFQSLGAAIYAP